MADEPSNDEEVTEEPKAKPNKLVLILLVVNLLGMIGVGAVVMLSSGDAQADASDGEDGEGEEDEDPYTFGPLLEMEPIIVNMPGNRWNHFIRVKLHLELRDAEKQGEVEAALVPIRNRLLIFFSELDPDAAREAGAKEELAEELVRVINDVMGAAMIRRVYYAEFVLQ